jgi:hypothetical protein
MRPSVWAWHSRSCPNSCSSYYNGCLVTWRVACFIVTKFGPHTFSVRASPFPIWKICIFVILYDLCLLPPQFHYVITNIRYLENSVELADRCAPRIFNNGAADNLVLQALQFRNVSLILGLNCSLLNREQTLNKCSEGLNFDYFYMQSPCNQFIEDYTKVRATLRSMVSLS